jgi:tetratricopeptide (TPR) repeat protein
VLRAARRFEEAETEYGKAIRLLTELTRTFPDEPNCRHDLAVVYNNLGNVLSNTKDYRKAKSAHGQALDLFKELAMGFPKVPVFRQELANTYNSLGNVLEHTASLNEALSAWQCAEELLRKLIAERPGVAAYQGDLGLTVSNQGLVYFKQGKLAAARTQFQQAIEHLRAALKPNPEHAVYRQILRHQYQNLAEVLVQSGEHMAAAEAARALPSVLGASSQESYFAACFLARCVPLAGNDSRCTVAERKALTQQYADRALDLLHDAVRKGFADREALQKQSGEILRPLAERADFRELLQQLAAKTQPPQR